LNSEKPQNFNPYEKPKKKKQKNKKQKMKKARNFSTNIKNPSLVDEKRWFWAGEIPQNISA
jgi:hypothetical protein